LTVRGPERLPVVASTECDAPGRSRGLQDPHITRRRTRGPVIHDNSLPVRCESEAGVFAHRKAGIVVASRAIEPSESSTRASWLVQIRQEAAVRQRAIAAHARVNDAELDHGAS